MTPPDAPMELIHASCVAVGGRAVLITGPSGSGKSGLALQLMACGAMLVADDQTEVFLRAGRLMARGPLALRGLIEARGFGILRAPVLDEAEVVLTVDLATSETDRLPSWRQAEILGVHCDLVRGAPHAHFPAAVLCYLRAGRVA